MVEPSTPSTTVAGLIQLVFDLLQVLSDCLPMIAALRRDLARHEGGKDFRHLLDERCTNLSVVDRPASFEYQRSPGCVRFKHIVRLHVDHDARKSRVDSEILKGGIPGSS